MRKRSCEETNKKNPITQLFSVLAVHFFSLVEFFFSPLTAPLSSGRVRMGMEDGGKPVSTHERRFQ